jgi:histidinol phosphatase-like enzyme
MNIDLSQSFMIGDQERDILMAEKMGSQGILVLTGGGRKTRAKLNLKKVKVVKNIQGACTWILSQKEISLS